MRMYLLLHGMAILVSIAAGLVVGAALPVIVPGMRLDIAIAFGALTALALALAQGLFVLARLRSRLGTEVSSLRNAHGTAMRELAAAREEARRIHEAIQAADKRKRGGKNEGMHSFDDVVAEVKVLQNLVNRLSAGSFAATGTRDTPAVDASAAPALAAAAAEDNPGEPSSGSPAGQADEPAGNSREMPPVARELDEQDILNVVREGLKSDRVDLVLQPIVKLPQRKHRFYECYSRIHDGRGRIIVPEQYLGLARNAGLIAPIDNMLLFRCVQLVRRVQRAQYNVGFFCNISSHTLADTPFLRDFIAFMAENLDLAPNLIFEFAQTDMAGMTGDVAANITRLGSLGFRFSIDKVTRLNMDYAELSRHRFRYLKIEAGTLLRHIRATEAKKEKGAEGESRDGAEAAKAEGPEIDVRTFKAMLDRLGIDLIVEKIETEKELVELLDFNIDYGQGYLFGEPRLARPEAA